MLARSIDTPNDVLLLLLLLSPRRLAGKEGEGCQWEGGRATKPFNQIDYTDRSVAAAVPAAMDAAAAAMGRTI